MLDYTSNKKKAALQAYKEKKMRGYAKSQQIAHPNSAVAKVRNEMAKADKAARPKKSKKNPLRRTV